MSAAARRTAGPDQPVTPQGTGPAPCSLSTRALTALVSHLAGGGAAPAAADAAPGPFDPYIRRALERAVLGAGAGTSLWRVIAEKHPEIWRVIGGDPTAHVALHPQPLPPDRPFSPP